MVQIVRCRCVAACLVGVLTLSGTTALGEDSAEAARSLPQVDDDCLGGSLVPLGWRSLDAGRHDALTQKTLQEYYDSILDWGRFLRSDFRVVPDHPDWGYYGDGDHRENAIRAICYAVCVNAFLAEVEPPTTRLEKSDRARFRSEAIAAMRYLVQSHKSGGGACLSGRSWGNQWQSAMWARSLGFGAWLLWEDLDRSTRRSVARVVEFEADRFVDRAPKSRVVNDTGAEENAWNAGLAALACCMMPDHPRADLWDQAAKRYMYNTFSIAVDKNDHSMGDDGRAVREWVTTVNAHPDLTVENHGLVHVGYLKNAHAMMLEGGSPYVLTDRKVPKACRHHMDGVLDILLRCLAWDGAPVCFGGNDWKLVHTQCSDVINFALTGVLDRDARAARAAATSFEWLRRIQKQYGGCYTVRRDLEHNGLVGSRLVCCYLVFAKLGLGVEPLSQQELDRQTSGVRFFEHGRAIVHRTPTKFVSFAWGSNRMALALPRDGTWVAWPHF
ncbi:MAG: hypothetical protein JW888_15180, partial [Pirellulales bacterium]|nr:hypothetical protein [Pirellulales bacterium]